MWDDCLVAPGTLWFDEASSRALEVLQEWREEAGELSCPNIKEALAILVRDVHGRCGVVLSDRGVRMGSLDTLRERLRQALGPHALPDQAVLLTPAEHVAAHAVWSDPALVRVGEDGCFWLLDRLQTNQEWLVSPLRTQPVVPLGVGYSIKGGVGRSTALAMLALAMARAGRQVVVLDLDLEAPGIGEMLLAEPDRPERGVIDWLSEALIGNLDHLLEDMVGEATAREYFDTFGKLWVIPAAGVKTREYMNKLGRVYMPTYDPGSGRMQRLAYRLDQLLGQITERLHPDVVLLDARAGLHDMGAAVVTQLGAQVFLFSRDDAQSWRSLEYLLVHLQRSRQIGIRDEDSDLRLRMKMVASMMEDFGTSLRVWKERAYDVWNCLYDRADDTPYGFSATDDAAPHHPLVVGFTPFVRKTALNHKEIREQWDLLFPAFQGFVEQAQMLMFIQEEP
ncbi:MAG: P-loop NTPase [Magnetococcales bacterium]|nr:P-loop NTPase [Magnetococcales bacterium]